MTTKSSHHNDNDRGHHNDTHKAQHNDTQSVMSILGPYIVGALIAVTAVIIAKYMFGVVMVQGSSMNPTYYNGDLVRAVNHFSESDIKAGDVVTFRIDGERLIKRVVGVPGDIIAYEDGVIYINGEPEKAEFSMVKDGGILDKGKIKLGKDEYFCMGDNRNNSRDCRMFGPIKFSQIDEKIIGTYVHWDRGEGKITDR